MFCIIVFGSFGMFYLVHSRWKTSKVSKFCFFCLKPLMIFLSFLFFFKKRLFIFQRFLFCSTLHAHFRNFYIVENISINKYFLYAKKLIIILNKNSGKIILFHCYLLLLLLLNLELLWLLTKNCLWNVIFTLNKID